MLETSFHKVETKNLENGLDILSTESFYFEKINKPVDIALISFLDHNYRLNPLEILNNVKSNCKNINNLPASKERKIDGYYLPSSPEFYQPDNNRFVKFITKSIADASIDAHNAENFIFYDQHFKDRQYFYKELEKELSAKSSSKKSSVLYHFAQVESPTVGQKPNNNQAIIFICIDPNLIDQALEKIEKSYNLGSYQVVALPGGGYSLVNSETKENITLYIKNHPDSKIIICSHGANPSQNEDNSYNCGGYQIFEKVTGTAAYNQAKLDMLQAKKQLENEIGAQVDTVMNVATYMGKGKTKGSKLYKATFEVI